MTSASEVDSICNQLENNYNETVSAAFRKHIGDKELTEDNVRKAKSLALHEGFKKPTKSKA